MQIVGTVSGQGNKNADGLERLTVVVKKGDAKVIPYHEGGEIAINFFIENDSYQAKMRTDRSYVLMSYKKGTYVNRATMNSSLRNRPSCKISPSSRGWKSFLMHREICGTIGCGTMRILN